MKNIKYLAMLVLVGGCSHYDAELQIQNKYPCWSTYEDFQNFLRSKHKKQFIHFMIDQNGSEQWFYVNKVYRKAGLL